MQDAGPNWSKRKKLENVTLRGLQAERRGLERGLYVIWEKPKSYFFPGVKIMM